MSPFRYMMPPERNPPPPEPDYLAEALMDDEAATLRYHDRMLDLDRRYDRWLRGGEHEKAH